MLEARLNQAETLKKVLDAVKELVTDANFDCTDEGIKLQAMDNSHVALVSLALNAPGFVNYRCDRDMSLGMSLASLQKIIKCAGNNDVVTLRADESHDILGLLFENKEHDRVGEYEMKLMDIDQEHLGIPDTVYDAEIMLPSAEFARIIRDLKELGESVKIEVSKDGVRFSADGDIGSAAVTLKQTSGDRARNDSGDDDEDDEEQEGSDAEAQASDADEDQEEEEVKDEDDDEVIIEDEKPAVVSGDEAEVEATQKEGSGSPAPKPSTEDADADADADEKPAVGSDMDEDDEEAVKSVKSKKTDKSKKAASAAKVKKEKEAAAASKKRKAASEKKKKVAKKGKTAAAKGKAKEETPRQVVINIQQAVSLTFSIKYLSNFAKSTPLSDYVHLHMSNEVPLLVEYRFEAGHIRYYLAPKIAEE